MTAPEQAAQGSLWFIVKEHHEILLLATPPADFPLEHSLHQAVCQLLGCSATASLAPLLSCPPSEVASVLPLLRVAPPDRWQAASVLGSAGAPCSPDDEVMLQLKPLRAYFGGEVVAVEAAQREAEGASVDGARAGIDDRV